MCRKGETYHEKDLSDRSRLRQLRQPHGRSHQEDRGRCRRRRELHDPEDDRRVRRGSGPQGRDEGRPQKLQEGRGRLRDLSVRELLPLTPRTNAPGRFLRQNSNSPPLRRSSL